jgi:hypothetical protein
LTLVAQTIANKATLKPANSPLGVRTFPALVILDPKRSI